MRWSFFKFGTSPVHKGCGIVSEDYQFKVLLYLRELSESTNEWIRISYHEKIIPLPANFIFGKIFSN